MATYEEIYGKRVKDFDSDPTLESSYEGQVWYDKSTGVLKSVVPFKAWSSASAMVNALARSQGAGTTSAGLSMGGQDQPGTKLTVTEEYNGTGWSLGGSMPAAKSDHAGAGTQTAAYAAGGSPYLNSAYNYNGTSWSGIPNIGTARQKFAGCGTTTASLVFGAQVPGSPPQGGQTEEYNGSSWSEQNDLGTARAKLAGCGTQTAGLGFGGYQPTIPSQPKQKAQTEQYDGTSWSEVSDLITAVNAMGGAGTQTAAIAFGGASPPIASTITITQDWDGTSWTTSPATLSTAVNSNGGAGTSTSALSMGGYAPTATNNAEEYNVSINTITAAAWASGGSLNTGRTLGGSAITSATSGIVFGGTSPYTGKTESYNGSSFSETGDMNTARSYLSGFGTSTAAVAAGGYLSTPGTPNVPKSEVEEWNGSAWSEETNLPAARKSAGNCGTLTAGLIFGGSSAQPYTANIVTTTFEYDGSSWTAGGALPEGKGQAASGGTQTAAFYAGGVLAPGGRSSKTAFYNGSSWSEGADVATISPSSGGLGATGTTSAGLATSGDNLTNIYDGTAWATSPNYSTARNRGFGGATASDALLVGGYSAPLSPAYRAETEEFTGETETVTASTLTTS